MTQTEIFQLIAQKMIQGWGWGRTGSIKTFGFQPLHSRWLTLLSLCWSASPFGSLTCKCAQVCPLLGGPMWHISECVSFRYVKKRYSCINWKLIQTSHLRWSEVRWVHWLGNMVTFIRPVSQASSGSWWTRRTWGLWAQLLTRPPAPHPSRTWCPTRICFWFSDWLANVVHAPDPAVCLDAVSPTVALLATRCTLKSRSFSQVVHTTLPVDLGHFSSRPAGQLCGYLTSEDAGMSQERAPDLLTWPSGPLTCVI